MEILNFKRQYMSSSGSSVLHGMSPIIPMLDLLVRESIQNSFDAKNKHERFIREEFNCGEFDSTKLSKLFGGIEYTLSLQGLSSNNKFISVRDFNTSGLTGPVRLSDIEGTDWGKFLNLVRNFGKSKKESGSGGSWGYGKTTFYKLGLGIVIYYTRIQNGSTYEERLMACIVENEQNKNGLLYKQQYPENTGIAWWGKLNEDKSDILPITNHDEIMEVLNCFDIRPYINDETGTAVIIPYIDETNLLNQTSSKSLGDDGVSSWCHSIESYLSLSFQKWYPTRCNNNVGNIEYIDAYINNKKIERTRMYPIYEVIQHLYNYHFGIVEDLPYEIINQDLTYKTTSSFKQKTIGNLYYCLLDRDNLKMNVPHNYASPIEYITNQNEFGEEYKNIICFCRKPGMILKYDIDGTWTGTIKSPDQNKYLVGLFIPNSNNVAIINGKTMTLEDYLRASESAEHNDWKDITEYTFSDTGEKIDCSNIKVVGFIRRRLKSSFESIIGDEGTKVTTFVGSELNKRLADLFLPKKGFGHNPNSSKPLPLRTTSPQNKRVKSTLKVGDMVVDSSNRLGKEFELVFNKKSRNISVEFKINTESDGININKWEENSSLPIEMCSIQIDTIIYQDGNIKRLNVMLVNNQELDGISFEKKLSDKQTWYGFEISVKEDNISSIKGRIIYNVVDPTINVTISQGRGAE